jgi:SAM-dependent methyltransferase
MNLLQKVRRHGLRRSVEIASYLAGNGYAKWRTRNVQEFMPPTAPEEVEIERLLTELGANIVDYAPDSSGFAAFQAAGHFPPDYHGGRDGSVWDEKLLEHWIAAERLSLAQYGAQDIYIDIAAGGSPWAKALRSAYAGQAFAIDLSLDGSDYEGLDYYRVENGTRTSFEDASVSGASLQCAFEMFMRDDDVGLIREFARILKPGGKAVILPLYLHTHYCAYASPRYFGKGYCDAHAKEYVCRDWDTIPSARYYDTSVFKRRILDTIEGLGMHYRILVLRNKADFGDNIYCHFILEIIR